MKTLKDPVFESMTTSDFIVRFIGSLFFTIIGALIIITTISVVTIIGFELASWIWGDENVIYWISNLF